MDSLFLHNWEYIHKARLFVFPSLPNSKRQQATNWSVAKLGISIQENSTICCAVNMAKKKNTSFISSHLTDWILHLIDNDKMQLQKILCFTESVQWTTSTFLVTKKDNRTSHCHHQNAHFRAFLDMLGDIAADEPFHTSWGPSGLLPQPRCSACYKAQLTSSCCSSQQKNNWSGRKGVSYTRFRRDLNSLFCPIKSPSA